MPDFVKIVFAAGIIVAVVALLGLVGACSQKKRYLAPYLLLVVACVGVQMAAVAIVAKFNSSLIDARAVDFSNNAYDSATASVMVWLQTNTEYVFDQAKCSMVTTPVTGDLIACSASDSTWFETFVNQKCSADLSRCTDATVDAERAFCLCQNALTDELDNYSEPVLVAALSLIGLEVLLLVFVISICCIGRHRKKRAHLEAPLHQQPAAQYVYVEHTSVPPAARSSKNVSGQDQAVAHAPQTITLV
jgi:hypothetical protein